MMLKGKHLSNEMKHLIVDFFFGLCDKADALKAEKAVSEDNECSRLYEGLETTVGRLKSLPKTKCPDEVVTRMFEKIRAKTESQKNLETLLRSEFNYKSRRNFAFIGKISKIAAMIAVIVAIGATYAPVTKRMRFMAMNNLCQRNLANIGTAISTYAADNAGMLPSVSGNGSSWWKVGSQKETDHSNTRNLWLLVRNGYSDVNDFACPARPIISDARLKVVNVCDYNKDFPSKDFVNYSFRIFDNKPVSVANMKRTVIAADSNPLFEENSTDKYSFFKSFHLNDKLLKASSINHSGKGQNIMFVDNSVSFTNSRTFSDDDIYTVQNTSLYSGTERPINDSDVFLAP